MMEPGGTTWFRNVGCPVWQCDILRSWEKSSENIQEEDYDAVIFFDPTWEGVRKKPAKRSPHQHYVWLTYEAPGYHSYLNKWSESTEFFNWTVTYRWDSSFVAPDGYFRPFLTNEIAPQKKNNYAEGKSKMVIWFVTNCKGAKNGRFDYVKRLQSHIQVDIYGGCGPFKCARENQSECRAMMERDYKFVIAFENSLCLDYVTEKLYFNMKYNIVPIVQDLHGNYARFAPAGSFINALDFRSVKELADYLKVLDGNDTLYNQYFEWKQHYVVETSDGLTRRSNPARFRDICRLCSILHDSSQPINVVKNLTKWWNDEARCKVIKFPSIDHDGSDRWLAQDYDPPYHSEPWRPGTFGSG